MAAISFDKNWQERLHAAICTGDGVYARHGLLPVAGVFAVRMAGSSVSWIPPSASFHPE
jgi:hypothetical protein